MLLEELKKEEYNAGKAEGIEIGKSEGIEIGKSEGIEIGTIQSIITILSAKGNISRDLMMSIESINDLSKLQELVVLAAKVASIEEFQKELK